MVGTHRHFALGAALFAALTLQHCTCSGDRKAPEPKSDTQGAPVATAPPSTPAPTAPQGPVDAGEPGTVDRAVKTEPDRAPLAVGGKGTRVPEGHEMRIWLTDGRELVAEYSQVNAMVLGDGKLRLNFSSVPRAPKLDEPRGVQSFPNVNFAVVTSAAGVTNFGDLVGRKLVTGRAMQGAPFIIQPDPSKMLIGVDINVEVTGGGEDYIEGRFTGRLYDTPFAKGAPKATIRRAEFKAYAIRFRDSRQPEASAKPK